MKFTSEDLLNAMGLKIGDRIKVDLYDVIFEIKRSLRLSHSLTTYDLTFLIDKEFEILPRRKILGNKLCRDFTCDKCPLKSFQFCRKSHFANPTLYDLIEGLKTADEELYDFYKKRLDKEVEE